MTEFTRRSSAPSRAGRAIAVAVALTWAVVAWGAAEPVEWASKITEKELGGAERYLVYASTDKPIYREGESLYLRAVVLNSADNTPASEDAATVAIKIRGPKGDVVFQGQSRSERSSAGFEWSIPEGTPGGRYTALVSSPSLGTPEAQRSFEIRAYRAPRLKTQIEFVREGYGPGDRVRASVEAERAEGGVPLGAAVSVVARVDGEEVFNEGGFAIGADGTCTAEFDLPSFIEVGDGTLSFIIEDGGVVETASKTIPILLQSLSISFHPEGGDLIAGLDSRVYVQARRPDGKPADVAGRIVRLAGEVPGSSVVATFATVHEGRGHFSFSPETGARYALLLDSPSGIARHFELPETKARGAVIESQHFVHPYGEKIAVAVASTADSRAASATLHKREVELDTLPITAGTSAGIDLDPKDAEGVLVVTVWDEAGTPLAERLVYRAPRFAVNVELAVSEGPFMPGSSVSVDILTTDENGRPVEAVVGLTVTDDAVLEMIETRDQAPRLPVMVALENDVQELADAHVYLDPGNPEAPMALDLLLGTQGWRRFILVRYEAIKGEFPEDARRALAERIPVRQPPVPVPLPVDGVFRNRNIFPQAAAANRPQADGAGAPEDIEEIAAQAEPLEEQVAGRRDQKLRGLGYIIDGDFARDRMELEQKRVAWVVVREYAHQVRPNRKANDRIDFSETLYWNAGIRTSARDGKASIEFGLSDSVTAFRLMGDAFGRNGALGSNDLVIESVEPFFIEPKLPLAVTVGDVIEVPVALINSTDEEIADAKVLVRGEGLSIEQPDAISLAPGERSRVLVRVVAREPGSFALNISAAAGPYTDSVTRSLRVEPSGFPMAIHHGGLLGPDRDFQTEFVIPEQIAAGSLSATAKVYPSPLASMEEALNALLRQPSGCFEQTSSTNYPLVMAQQYFTTHQGIEPEKIAEARKLLDAGYQRLIGFETSEDGYEWFGASPGHEALTAYGLMEFTDMAKVMPVDEQMIERTRDWLLSRRDGKGGFERNARALDSFGGAPAPTTNAYILWTLLESGEDPSSLKTEIAGVKAEAMKSADSYVIALAVNILHLAGDRAAATTLSKKLAEAVDADGAVSGSTTSITRSGGDALAIETTSLAILGWLKDDQRWAAQVETSMQWLFERSKAGRFGSTQSTILALKAINTYDAARAVPKQPGSVRLRIDGQLFGSAVKFNKDTKGAIELPDFSAALSPGSHTIELLMSDGSKMPFALAIEYSSTLPASSEASALELHSTLSRSELIEGEPLEMELVIEAGSEDAPTPIAILGIPGGLEVRHEQLKELVSADRISAYEVIGRELVLYWRALRGGEKRTLPIALSAAIPGSYTGPASRAYLYYTDEDKVWERGHEVVVRSRR